MSVHFKYSDNKVLHFKHNKKQKCKEESLTIY